MEQKKNSKRRLVDKVKTIVSEATESVETAADKAIKSSKSALSDAVTASNLKDIGKTLSKTAGALIDETSEKVASARSIVTGAVSSEKVQNLVEKATESAGTVVNEVSEKYESAKKIVAEKASMETLKNVGEAAADIASLESVKRIGQAVSEGATMENTKDALKYASGIKGYKEIKKAREIKNQAEEKILVATETTEKKKAALNHSIEKYAEIKLGAINNTICVFVEYLKKIGQKNKGREYEALKSIDVNKEDIADMEDLGISTINLAKGAAGSSLIGAIALFGTKAAVLQGVVSFASASTGTAISGLSGAAATNATLTFLGGGSIASGGGGMATGAMVLGGITAGAFLAVGALTGGILLSAQGSRALTMATQYAAEVEKGISTLEKSWIIMDGISERVNELESLTLRLEKRALIKMKHLREFIPDFDSNNLQHKKAFQETALLMKSISELANTPILDEDGCVTNDSSIVAGKVKSILNT